MRKRKVLVLLLVHNVLLQMRERIGGHPSVLLLMRKRMLPATLLFET